MAAFLPLSMAVTLLPLAFSQCLYFPSSTRLPTTTSPSSLLFFILSRQSSYP